MSMQFERKSYEELLQIAEDVTCSSYTLANLYTWLRTNRTLEDPEPSETFYKRLFGKIDRINSILASNPSTGPETLMELVQTGSFAESALNNPSLPLYFLENPDMFFAERVNRLDRFLIILQDQHNIPLFILEALQRHPLPEIVKAAQAHIGYGGEVKNSEDYAKGIQSFGFLPIEKKYDSKLRSMQLYPRFLEKSESNNIIWSPRKVIHEVTHCNAKINKIEINKEKIAKIEKGDILAIFLSNHMSLMNFKTSEYGKYVDWEKKNRLLSCLKLLYHQEITEQHFDYRTLFRPEVRFFLALNPTTPTEHLEKLSQDTNRYVRTTARAAIEFRAQNMKNGIIQV
jgi:hypothetical protein